ncbi:indole acetimide hydrolase [Photorhabdus noenieputensis]|nr:indole acetimide hydrolase [Photorhabdus noenieputensis]
MMINPSLLLAAEAAMNMSPHGFRQNRQKRLRQYQRSRHQKAFIALDEARLGGSMSQQADGLLPLCGLPFSCKDNINAVGFATTAGTPGLADFFPSSDADIVARLKVLGAELVGKNNMHELSFGVTSCNGTWGHVLNPCSEAHIAGGSSGGSAAAVAAGVVAFSVGTDTGGSVRIPAALCGVAGFRPSTGRYPTDGIVPVSHTKDTPGFIAPQVADIAFLDAQLMRGTVPLPVMPRRLGVSEAFLWSGLDESVEQPCRVALARLVEAGVTLVPVDDRHWGEMNAEIQFPVPFYEFFIDFPRFLLAHGLEERFTSILGQLKDEHVRRILLNQLEQAPLSWSDYLTGLMTIGKLRNAWRAAFEKHRLDAMVFPTVTCATPRHDQASCEGIFEQLVRNTDLASNLGVPSITLPVVPTGQLPVGLSLEGLPGDDVKLLALAQAVASLLGNHS